MAPVETVRAHDAGGADPLDGEPNEVIATREGSDAPHNASPRENEGDVDGGEVDEEGENDGVDTDNDGDPDEPERGTDGTGVPQGGPGSEQSNDPAGLEPGQEREHPEERRQVEPGI